MKRLQTVNHSNKISYISFLLKLYSQLQMSENFTSIMPNCVVGCIAFYCVSGEVERSLAILLFLHDSSHVAVHIFKSEKFRLED